MADADDSRRRRRAANRRDRRRLSAAGRVCGRRRDKRRERPAARAHAASSTRRPRSRLAESGRPHRGADASARVRRADHHAHRAGRGVRSAPSASRWARTTTSPSRSARASSSRACRRCCGGPRARPTAVERVQLGDLTLDVPRLKVTRDGDAIDLTATEFQLLAVWHGSRAASSPARSSSTRCAARTASRSTAPSTRTSRTSAARSSPIRGFPGTWRPCTASATGAPSYERAFRLVSAPATLLPGAPRRLLRLRPRCRRGRVDATDRGAGAGNRARHSATADRRRTDGDDLRPRAALSGRHARRRHAAAATSSRRPSVSDLATTPPG